MDTKGTSSDQMEPRPEGSWLLYLGISGVLHPSASLYSLVFGRDPWEDGHQRYECVPVLEAVLKPWPQVKIVLTSTLPWRYGLDSVLQNLGPLLAERVVGHTYADLTTKATRTVVTLSGRTRNFGYSKEAYWRMDKAQVVQAHVDWCSPERWVAVDDEDGWWPYEVRRDRLVLTDGCDGLKTSDIQDRLHTVLLGNFGR